MKVKLDENIPVSAASALAAQGHDVDTVHGEGLAGCDDAAVLRAATSAGRLLVTLDRGLGDIRRYPPGSHAGIVVVRVTDQSAAAVYDAVDRLARHPDLVALSGTVTILQDGLLRVRRPTP
ncbi:MAG TPA: DUF5615 family PIN-like protein [Mycobacteriales bacterium]|nr:DUF5615 family PIN-like protein [Mycobacteriales bacterium]